MKTPLLAVLAFSGAVMLGPNPVHAQAAASTNQSQAQQGSIDQDIDLLRKDIRSQKKQLIAANLSLTDAEAQAFWPIYDQYTADLVKLNNTKYEAIKEYARSYSNLTDAQADDLTKRVLKLDADVVALRAKYQPTFRKVLPAKKCALYEQVERTAQMLIDVQLASQIPLVQP